MNMLINKVPFGLLSDEERELFNATRRLDRYSLEFWQNGTWAKNPASFELGLTGVYRLKLKEGEWYKYKDKYGENTFEWTDNKESDFIKCDLFRPATQEEIDSVKPKETFVDVKIGAKFTKIGEGGTYTKTELVKEIDNPITRTFNAFNHTTSRLNRFTDNCRVKVGE